MEVKATKGLKCPYENKPREYISDNKYVKVPNTAYYKRLIADGSLEQKPEKIENNKK